MRPLRIARWAPALIALSLFPRAHAEEPEACPGLIASAPALITRAAVTEGQVGLRFVGHATFLIETPEGVRIATDYSDGTRTPVAPDVATMNKAHSTHFTLRPEPGIQPVLKGWNPMAGRRTTT
jgi:hypothetical protein